MSVCRYVCVVFPLTSVGPPLAGVHHPRPPARHLCPLLLWGWGWGPLAPTYPRLRQRPSTPARPATNHTRPTSRLDRQVGRFCSTTSNSVPRRSRPRTSPAHHEVAVLGRTSLPKVFWILRSEGLLPRLLVLPAFFVSVSGPENPFLVWIEINVPCDRSCSPEKEQNQNFSTFVQPRAQTTGRHARDREGGWGKGGERDSSGGRP